MASHMEGKILVEIDAPENTASYDEEAFLREEERLKAQLAVYLATGARIENLAEVIAQVVGEELGS